MGNFEVFGHGKCKCGSVLYFQPKFKDRRKLQHGQPLVCASILCSVEPFISIYDENVSVKFFEKEASNG